MECMTLMVKLNWKLQSLCDYSDAYIRLSGTITITAKADDDATKRADERDKGVILCVIYWLHK